MTDVSRMAEIILYIYSLLERAKNHGFIAGETPAITEKGRLHLKNVLHTLNNMPDQELRSYVLARFEDPKLATLLVKLHNTPIN